ncbi:hypothetical protein CSC94_23505 [Zhengella mangrovi]|uniref:3-methylmercaptopropionyl-CoA ligase n=2 Tax=Zhengella mangrovi TaxID=1982044 RepID=A0A2G1QGF7_9HYPH|nr:hypothetical protein CSC94_23505 [Zhengella mangrovi]
MAAAGAAPNVNCLADLVATAVRRAPNTVAIEHDRGTISYGAFWQRVQKCANALIGLDLPRGARVAIFAYNSPEYLQLYLALQLSGLVVVPVNYRLSSEELRFVLDDSGAKALFIDGTLVPLLNERRSAIDIADDRIVVLGETDSPNAYNRFIDHASDSPVALRSTPLSPAAIFYTSGTTGFPKGAVLSHLAILTRFSSWGWRFGLTEEDTTFVPGPIFHQSFGSIALVSLCVGARVVLRSEFRGDQAIEDFRKYRVTWSFLVPNMISTLLEQNPGGGVLAGFETLRGIMSSGSRLPTPLIDGFEAAFPRASLSDAYGWTESGWITYCRHEDMMRTGRSLGQASFGCRLSIRNDAGEEMSAGEAGQVYACNPVPFLGYHGKPDATAAMRQGPWETGGDVGYIDEEGFLHLLDRKRDLIISGGENIYPAEIERVLAEHPEVLEVAVVGVPDPKWGEHPRACIVPRDGASISVDSITAFCAGRLAKYKFPKSIHTLEMLPRNSMGKVLRRTLREQFWEEGKEKT